MPLGQARPILEVASEFLLDPHRIERRDGDPVAHSQLGGQAGALVLVLLDLSEKRRECTLLPQRG